MEEEYLTVGEIAESLRTSEWSVRRWIKSGALPAVLVGTTYRVPLSGYRAYIEANTVTARETR